MPTDKQMHVETDRYSDFVRSLELIIIALTSSKARINRSEYFAAKEPDLTVDVGLKPKRLARDHFDLHAEAKVKLARKRSGPLFDLSVTYELHFHGKPPIDARLVRRFADRDAHTILWPYLREYVSDMSARMYIPPILLPVPM